MGFPTGYVSRLHAAARRTLQSARVALANQPLQRAIAWLTPRGQWVCAGAVVALLVLFASVVDLTPRVGPDFFFGSDDPSFQDTARILELFPSDAQLIVSAEAPDIFAKEYLERIRTLSDRLSGAPGVLRVMSVSRGPGDVPRALASPLWRRLLVADSQASTLVIALVDPSITTELVREVETIVDELGSETFDLRLAGMPYIVEMIRRNLVRDLKVFSTAAVVIFGGLILLVFRSTKILAGTLCACLSAIMLTLLVQQAVGIAMGPLSANLSTIVFVLTQSHIIFLTGNWQRMAADQDTADGLARRAARRTFTASFWCMVTTLLGFLSLLLVEAKPLRELGVGGAIGTVMAIGCAYGLFPPFLRWQGRPAADTGPQPAPLGQPAPAPEYRRRRARAVLVACGLCAVGLPFLNTDPSLFAYFAPGTELRDGLEFIDRNGGSSPLQLIIGRPDGGRLDNNDAYERMWSLQGALSAHESVGTVVSLPVLMAEGHRRPVVSLLSWRRLLSLLSLSWFDNVASSFITPDRTQAMFLLRMHEAERTTDRGDVLAELTALVEAQGLRVNLVGGIYALQGRLAQLVASSLVTGLGALVFLFGVVGYIVSRSFPISRAMVGSVVLIPVAIFGCIGVFGVPVDIISAPAGNVCIGIGVDAMIHLALAVRLHTTNGTTAPAAWTLALREQGRPTLIAMGIVAAGFSIFALSSFPPTERFGLAIVFGSVIAAVATLTVFPVLAGAAGQAHAARAPLGMPVLAHVPVDTPQTRRVV